ncbi:maleylpyruvate isomerase family mycothiol-dependent enzyme [Actinoplanes solisilvae]|uniref:maleylpyruvate isomerase family mycothiol-dependent enzyme n=1 Tax=Actinoplanes solisilvae TaxID=2486853 RepID=UPI000FDB4DA7|nr:maleylpyruvate isomerase family mycothiol-dependent enzyme [Actinoplanes solisilvae]
MTMDPLVLLTDVDEATEELLRTVADLDPAAVGAPSLLPGWTAGHVLTHVARNADALTNLLIWARTGVETPPYASPEAREAGIDEGARRPLREQLADIRASHERFADAGAAMPAEAWAFVLPWAGNAAAAVVPWMRLREVSVHHVDLGAGYTPADWSEAFTLRLLREIVTGAGDDWPAMRLRPNGLDHALTIGTDPDPPVVGGPTKSIAAWLTGRADGADLTVSPDGELPTPARWK